MLLTETEMQELRATHASTEVAYEATKDILDILGNKLLDIDEKLMKHRHEETEQKIIQIVKKGALLCTNKGSVYTYFTQDYNPEMGDDPEDLFIHAIQIRLTRSAVTKENWPVSYSSHLNHKNLYSLVNTEDMHVLNKDGLKMEVDYGIIMNFINAQRHLVECFDEVESIVGDIDLFEECL